MVESTTAIISVISMIITSLSSIAGRISITTITTMTSVAAVMLQLSSLAQPILNSLNGRLISFCAANRMDRISWLLSKYD